jgi:trans-2,3-dihydro-3-hydroxyanthranilate isomerase
MARRFHTADVFSDRVFGGNPLAVFPDGAGLDAATMQHVARELNLSETVFVLPPDSPRHTRRLRIFTPSSEIPFAGHPTLGTAFILAALGEIALAGAETRVVFEEGVGPVPVQIEARGGAPVRMALEPARLPELGPPPPARAALAAALSLAPDALVAEGAEAPRAASCGLPFLFVPLRDRAALAAARLRREVWERELAGFWAPNLYLYTRDAGEPGLDFRARMFAPAHGVDEDPATGSAAAAFAGPLGELEAARDAHRRFAIVQGVEMGRPSRLELELEKRGGALQRVRVAGAAVLVSSGEMTGPGLSN